MLRIFRAQLREIGGALTVDASASVGAAHREACGTAENLRSERRGMDVVHRKKQLAAEVFHIVLAGLSNVRRHTCSTQVTLSLACANEHLSLRIANTVAVGAVPAPFVPRSIMERTAALGGCTRVERSADHGTVVVVDIPL